MGEDDRTFKVNFSSGGVSRLCDAVNEKLKEFMGEYTDDTLVEYVIVLLKNGRSKDEAKNELDVFLGDDSDSFVCWLWDHLESNLSLYVQPQELHPDGGPETKPAAGDQGGKPESHPIESDDAQKGDSITTRGHHHNRENKGLMRDGDENEVPLPHNSMADNVPSRDEPRSRDSQIKSSRAPRSTIHKKRRRNEEQQLRQREVSQSTVTASRRLLQFAVRDAVATSRPSNATAEPSLKRLRSVVATTTDKSLEEHPQRIRRASMSVAIKAMAEAVNDVTKVKPSRNVFDRLGHATNISNITNHIEYGGAAEHVEDGDFSVELENFHSSHHQRDDRSSLQGGNMPFFQDATMDSGLGYDGEDYDDVREMDATNISLSGTSGGNSQNFHYRTANNVNETLHRPLNSFGQPATEHNTSLRIASSVSMNTRKPQYLEEMEVAGVDNHKVMRGGSTLLTETEGWLMEENNNPTVILNKNEKTDAVPHQFEKTDIPAGVLITGPPTEDSDSRTIFVSNVHFAATKDSLSRHFNKFGEVLKVIILTDPATGQPKGSAYIEFMRKEAAELSLSLDGTSFISRILKIVKKSSAQPDAASVMTWPRVAQTSTFPIPRYGRVPFFRGIPTLYRARAPMKAGARSFQWKRGADSSVTETSSQVSNSVIPSPTARSLTYVRAETKMNGNSGSA